MYAKAAKQTDSITPDSLKLPASRRFELAILRLVLREPFCGFAFFFRLVAIKDYYVAGLAGFLICFREYLRDGFFAGEPQTARCAKSEEAGEVEVFGSAREEHGV